MILNGRNIDGLRASRIATLTRRRFVAGVACAVACAAAGLLVGCGSASKSAEVAAIEPYVSPYDLVRPRARRREAVVLRKRCALFALGHRCVGAPGQRHRLGRRCRRRRAVRFRPHRQPGRHGRCAFRRRVLLPERHSRRGGGHPGERLFLLSGADRRRGSRGGPVRSGQPARNRGLRAPRSSTSPTTTSPWKSKAPGPTISPASS